MSNFNQYFKNKGVKLIVERFFSGIDIYNHENKLTSIDYEIVNEPPQPASYYIENGLTATHKVRLEYTINDDPGVRYAEFEVPKEIDGAFIIEGAYRISTNRLGSDWDCRIQMSGSGDYKINFDFDRQFNISKRVLKIKKVNPDLGISERNIEIPYEDIDKTLEDPAKKELLKLTEKQSQKFEIKLDLDYKPEYITQKLIDECLAFGDDRLKDLIIDKTLESVPNSFMKYIFTGNNRRNFYSAKRAITSYWTKHGIIQEKVNSITTLCFRYFKGSSDGSAKDSNLQVPPGEFYAVYRTKTINNKLVNLVKR